MSRSCYTKQRRRPFIYVWRAKTFIYYTFGGKQFKKDLTKHTKGVPKVTELFGVVYSF